MSKKKGKNKRFRYENGVLNQVNNYKVYSPPKMTPSAVATNYKLNIPKEIYQKIMHWVNKANFEVSGFGSLDWDKDTNEFTVKSAILLKQKVGPASAEIDPMAMNKAMFQLRDEPNALKWHWHSHVKMGVFWSADDMEIIRSLGQRSWLVASVFNQREEIKTAFLTQTQVFEKPHDIFVDDIPTFIQEDVPEEVLAEWNAEYDLMVEAPKSYGTYDHGYAPAYLQQAFPISESHLDKIYSKPEKVKDEDYDEDGWAQSGEEIFYNPLHDKKVLSQEQMMNAIDNMEWQEIQSLRKLDHSFEKELTKYMTWKANVKRAEDYKPTWMGEYSE